MTFRHPNRRRVRQHVGETSMTQQNMRDQCDINQIMARYHKTGLLDHVNRFQGNYGEFADAPSYHEGLNKMLAAEAMFMTLPASIRETFDNDPGAFLEFALDEKNEEDMRSMGLLPKRPPVAAQEEPQVKKPPEPKPASVAEEKGAS